jgi:hypothetical protein
MLSRCQEITIYFGLGIHYLAKGMSQEEVEDMFTDGLVCFRAYNPETQAPMPLPSFLTPNAPKNSKTVGKTLHVTKDGTKVPRIPVAMQAPDRQVPIFSPQRAHNFSGQGLSLQQNTHRRRRYLFPAISLSRRCGHCKSCLNPSWKKACEVRRAEMLQAIQPNTYA